MSLQRLATIVVTAGLFASPALAQPGGGGGCQRGGMNQSTLSTGMLTASPTLNSTGFQSPQQTRTRRKRLASSRM